MEKYVVEARIYDNGKIITKVRELKWNEEEGCTAYEGYDIWIDIFDTEEEAKAFALEYKDGGYRSFKNHIDKAVLQAYQSNIF